jgi:hypothetical protein
MRIMRARFIGPSQAPFRISRCVAAVHTHQRPEAAGRPRWSSACHVRPASFDRRISAAVVATTTWSPGPTGECRHNGLWLCEQLSRLPGAPSETQYMREQLRRAGTPAPEVIGIDEVSIRKGHTYRIVVSDLIRRRPIWFGAPTDPRRDDLSSAVPWCSRPTKGAVSAPRLHLPSPSTASLCHSAGSGANWGPSRHVELAPTTPWGTRRIGDCTFMNFPG